MGNDSIERWLRLDQEGDKIQTIRYARKPSEQNYVDRLSEEFRFRIGEIVFSGDSDLLTYNDYQIVQKMSGGKRITVQFTYSSGEEAKPTFYLWVHYEIYPDLLVIRKWLTIQNLTDSAFLSERMWWLSLYLCLRDGRTAFKSGGAEFREVAEEPLPIPWEGGASDAFILVGDTSINSSVWC